eukprot:Gb_25046 [translate_table: standard]
MAQTLWNQEKKMVLVLPFMRPLQAPISTIIAKTKTKAESKIMTETKTKTKSKAKTKTSTPKGEEQHANGKNSFGGTETSGDIITLCKQGRLKEALNILNVMDQLDILPDFPIYSSLLHLCLSKKALPEGKLVHTHMSERGFMPDIFLANKILTMYSKCGSLVDARRVLDQMSERNVVSWTTMIAAYARHGFADEALKLFHEMQQAGVQPNQYTFASVLPACASLASMERGKEIHEEIVKSGFESNVFVGNALVDMYAKCGSIQDAHHVFNKMSERNVVSWTAMIAGYSQNEHFYEALKLFRQMQLKGVKPNANTFTSVLPACANLAALEHGLKVHENIVRTGCLSDIFVGNALVDMYSKCGNLENACQVFDEMPKRNVVSWSSMIMGYAMHGHGKEALQLFEQMQHSGIEPNQVTLIGVLSACCRSGLMDDGWKYFDCMSEDYNITPTMEHYSCMVDLLGRAGRLDEAQNFISKMAIKPNAIVWGSLLNACRFHTNAELGEQVAEHLFELDPKNPAPYVLLSNIYAAAGRQNDIQKVQKMMKDRRVKKQVGCSWIEVNKEVYAFCEGERSHPQTQQIVAELERLSGQMKEAGCGPDASFVMHDEKDQKENILHHHSEKLAITSGLINTSFGTPIRVVTNLRVCDDCHSAIKFISKIATREITVKDVNCFHHFKDGLCSCGDYW